MSAVSEMRAVVVDRAGLDVLLEVLRRRGFRTVGPVVRDGAVAHGPVETTADLPVGQHDQQGPGHYRLVDRGDSELFGWAVAQASWKREFFPAHDVPWRGVAERSETGGATAVRIRSKPAEGDRIAIFGARPCELVATRVTDRILGDEASVPDPDYVAARRQAFWVVAECGSPAATCFCSSMQSGPGVTSGFDLALTELLDGAGQRFVVRAGSDEGRSVLAELEGVEGGAEEFEQRAAVLERSEATMTRRMPGDVASLLARNLEHPRFDEVAERCLACGNCTLACPTCFCSTVNDTSTVDGALERHRVWASCFDLAHSEMHGGSVRTSTRSRYRQWITHKLSTWHDQFDTSGCVGCGRCITWCPVGIDITEEVGAIAASDGRGGEPYGTARPVSR